MPPVRIAVLASGAGSNLAALFDDLRAPDAPGKVTLVASNRAGTGALEKARVAGIATQLLPDGGRDADALLATLGADGIQLVVLAGYLTMVPAAVVDAYRGRIINVHPALLPAFGGAGMYGRHVHDAVLASGARISGVTVHLVDERYDRGTMLAQWPVPVRAGDTAESLAQRVLATEHRLLPAVVRRACAQLAARQAIVPCDLRADHFAAADIPAPACDDALVPA